MKIRAFGLDANGRSIWTAVDLPLRQSSPLRMTSAKQDMVDFNPSFHAIGEPLNGGPYEMHMTNKPQLLVIMSGQANHIMQSGEVRRSGPGDFFFVHGQALHHSNFAGSRDPVLTLSIGLPGTAGFNLK